MSERGVGPRRAAWRVEYVAVVLMASGCNEPSRAVVRMDAAVIEDRVAVDAVTDTGTTLDAGTPTEAAVVDVATDDGATIVDDGPTMLDAGPEVGADVVVADTGNDVGVVDTGNDVPAVDAGCTDAAASCPSRTNATPVCASGACSFVCLAGFGDCDSNLANGCETRTTTTATHCGMCGRACMTGEVCVQGTCRLGRRVFVTSTTHTGNLGGLAGGDAICAARAQAASLGGTWRAWISNATESPRTRFTQSTTPYLRVDGVQVAAGFADLTDNSLGNAISLTENGTSSTATEVFTGTTGDGYPANSGNGLHCGNWMTESGQAAVGASNGVNAFWSFTTMASCATARPLFCFEQ